MGHVFSCPAHLLGLNVVLGLLEAEAPSADLPQGAQALLAGSRFWWGGRAFEQA